MSAHRRLARHLTHPQVTIDPDLGVPNWSLNEGGRLRVAQLAGKPSMLNRTTRVISSTETKAIETALPLATAFGVRGRNPR
ncbi:hypothetical protein [Ruegeria meonggei]|uniref:hypothetical protein n=1 Tax=Ruegeria meonggei TaxID=1446476 RepID=UPI001F28F2A5|nr:hypothetical protein [Ruegeria meonggei]